MKTILFATLLASAFASTALADCNNTLIEFKSWSIKPIDNRTNEISTTFKSNSEKPIRMIDASGGYKDALGKIIGSFELDRDALIDANGEYTEIKYWGPHTFERLLKLRPEEVETYTCVRSVLYEDGSKEEFK